MPIFIIDKITQLVERALTTDEEVSFIAWYIEKKEHPPMGVRAVLRLSDDLYRRDVWLQCRCIMHDTSHPVVRLNLSNANRYYIHRIHSRGTHALHCPLFKEAGEEMPAHLQTPPKTVLKKTGALNFMSKRGQGLSASTTNATNKRVREEGTKRSSLCNALYRLLDDAGCNRLSFETQLPPFQSLLKTIRNTELIINKPLEPYFYFDIRKLVIAAISLRKDERMWPVHVPRHCLFLLNVTDVIDDKNMTVLMADGKTKLLTVSNKINSSSGRLGKRSGPYMALVSVTDSAYRPGFFEPFDAFVVPKYSEGSFVPVDSYYEREMLRHLYRMQYELHKAHIPFTIEKPLFDIPVNINEQEAYPVLPDFILKTPTKNLIIEVDGSLEETYKTRKYRTQALMGNLGEVFVFDAVTHDLKGDMPQALMAFCRRLREALC